MISNDLHIHNKYFCALIVLQGGYVRKGGKGYPKFVDEHLMSVSYG